MRWTCPKCGKKLDISNEQLIAGDGVIVCPQCLLQARQPMPKARNSSSDDKTPTSPQRKNSKNSSIDFTDDTSSPRQTPPPHKPRMKQASTTYRYTGLGGDSTSNTPKRKNTRKKKSSKKKQVGGISALGCLGRSIIITLLLFAGYILLGLLIEALQ